MQQRSRAGVSAIVVGALLISSTALAAARPTLALLPGAGEVAPGLDDALRREIDALDRYTLQGAEVTAAHVRSARELGLSCADDDLSCLAKLGILAQVQWVVQARASRREGAPGFELLLVDVEQGAERGRVARALGSVDEDARAAVLLLLAPERARGSLVVEVSPAGAALELDGAPVGVAPLAAPLDGLAPGDHTLTASLAGYLSERRTVTVPVGGAATVAVALEPEATAGASDAPSGSPWVLVGGATAAIGGAIAAGAGLGAVPFALYAADPKNNADPNREALKTTGQGLVFTAIAGGVALVAGTAVLGFGMLE